MRYYHFYRTDYDGRYLDGLTMAFPNDEIAVTKARELADRCNVEIWQGQMKIGVVQSRGRSRASFPLEEVHFS